MLKRLNPTTACLTGLVAIALLAPANLPTGVRGGDEPPAVPQGAAALAVSADVLPLRVGQSHRLLVSQTDDDGFETHVGSGVAFASDRPDVASVDNEGRITARGPGEAIVTGSANGKNIRTTVRVTATSTDGRVSFVGDLLPLLSKAGCNGGGCHAKPEGQNGFKLSVFAYDPQADYRAIVKGDRGRRVFPAAPEESLLLKKATGAVEHGGGSRFAAGSHTHQQIVAWISQGMPYSQPTDSPLVALDIYPKQRRYKPAAVQPLVVTARYADGTVRDVTSLAGYTSSEPPTARVDDAGNITVGSTSGEAVVTAQFMGEVAVTRVTVPTEQRLPESLYASLPANNFIDRAVYARLKDLGLSPSELCSDSEFIRRASLDAVGMLPTPDEVRAFLADPRPDKRARLVDELLARPAYADYWATKWGDLLRPNTQRVGVKPVYLLDQWIRQSLRENKPYDQFVREILTASGSTHENGPLVLFRDRRLPEDLATYVGQIFLGVRMECAKCHHHPSEKWSQGDFYQLAAFFGSLKRKGQGISAPISGLPEHIWFAPGGEVKHPVSGEVLPPKPPDGLQPRIDPNQDPRNALVGWMTRHDNPFFARAIVNRIWGELMGRGIVHPVDDFRASNPPSNERLLDALAEDFVEHGYDLKHLIGTILKSRTYQLSSLPNETNVADVRNYSRSQRRRLPAEVMLDAVSDLTGIPDSFDGLPAGSRAVRAWNNKLDSDFLDAFGRPDSSADCPCERDRGTNVVQALHLMHSQRLQEKIADKQGRAAKLAATDLPPEKIVEELYLAAYARLPDAQERQIAVGAFAEPGATRQTATEDVMWALINSAEFVFNH